MGGPAPLEREPVRRRLPGPLIPGGALLIFRIFLGFCPGFV